MSLTNAIRSLLVALVALPSSICLGVTFLERREELGMSLLDAGGSGWGDFNADGFVDLQAGAYLFVNNSGTGFNPIPGYSSIGLWGDFDNDGDLDLLDADLPVRLLRNQSGVSFTAESVAGLPMGHSVGSSVADFNGDALLDFYMGGFETPAYQPDALAINTGSGFSITTMASGGHKPGRGVTSCDFDEDGDMDIYVSNYRLEPNLLWVNDGAGNFSNQAASRGVAGDAGGTYPYGHTIGSSWGDFDNDGHIDLFVGNFRHNWGDGSQDFCKFYRNLGPSGGWNFQLMAELSGSKWQESYATPALADVDNDGDLDVFLTTVYHPNDSARLFRNDGNWVFTDVTSASGLDGLNSSGNDQAGFADIDNDGDLDLVTSALPYVNQGTSGHWLRVRLLGNGTTVNRSAIGAQVRIALGGETLTRQVEAGTGQGNMNELILHFGLGTNAGPVALTVDWPDGTTQVIGDVAVDQLVELGNGPIVDNRVGAIDVTQTSAYLTGHYQAPSGEPTDVCVYWGPTDMGATTNWPYHACFSGLPPGNLGHTVTNLDPVSTYHYRWYGTNASGSAWAEPAARFITTGGLPFYEPFDGRAFGMLDGQHGWQALPADAAVVQGDVTHQSSPRACSVLGGSTWQAFSGEDRTNVVWTDVAAIPRRMSKVPEPPDAGTTVAFYVEAGTGTIVVYDGTTRTVLSGQPPAPDGEWTRFTWRADYASGTWDLWTNRTHVAGPLGFYDGAVSEMTRVSVSDKEGSSQATIVDDVSVTLVAPAGVIHVDTDGDHMDDEWEEYYFQLITASDGSGDWDMDDSDDLAEFNAGTNPDDPASFPSTPNEIPFDEPFDALAAGEIDGQHGWRSTPYAAATVQNAETFGGSARACRVYDGTLWHVFTGDGRTNVVYTDLYAKPRHMSKAPTVTGAHSAVFYVDKTTGRLTVYDGPSPVLLSGAPQVSATQWSRFTWRTDYTTGTWALWLNGALVAGELGFHSTGVTAFARFNVSDLKPPSGESFVDGVTISPTRPDGIPFYDGDADAMDDDWELAYFGSTAVSSGAGDWDEDASCDYCEFRAGTNPLEAGSRLGVTRLAAGAAPAMAIDWQSVDGKSYAIQSAPAVDGPWSNMLIGIVAAPPTNTHALDALDVQTYYRIALEEE